MPQRSAHLRVLVAVLLAACEPGGVALSLSLQTDWVPGAEFSAVRVTVPDAEKIHIEPAFVGGDHGVGVRIADLAELAPSARREIVVELLNARGEAIDRQAVIVEHRTPRAITVLISRDCGGLSCPADDAAATRCLGRRCVRPECVSGAEEECPESQCASGADCLAGSACVEPACVNGTCIQRARPDACRADEFCSPERGCSPLGTPIGDAGASRDAGLDGSIADGGAGDAGSTDAGSTDAGAPDAGPVTCECAVTTDACDEHACYDPSLCGPVTDCPTGYACQGDGRCRCDDVALCGVVCSGPAGCGAQQRCLDDRCQPEIDPECRVDYACADAEHCIPGEERCGVTSGNAVGETCAENADCASAICVNDVCVQRCEVSADCAADQRCAELDSRVLVSPLEFSARVKPLGCIRASGLEPECQGCLGQTFCRATLECSLGPVCRGGADCGQEAHCEGETFGSAVYAAECRPGAGDCPNADDIRISGHQDLCTDGTRCSLDVDCADGRTCRAFRSMHLCATDPS